MMLTDMVGYSALTQRDEAAALSLVREQEQIVRPLLRKFEGRTVKMLGDGFLAEFSNARAAVECAIEIQGTTHRRNQAGLPEHLELRIGVHLGDVVHRSQDVFGDAVNIVARIEPLADPGGICISQQVYDQVRNVVDARFESIGSPTLKNVSTPGQVYRIALPSARPVPASSAKDLPRIAVLPLANLSGRVEDEYFADGITEELIQMLSKIQGLRVIGRSSVMRFKKTDRSPTVIARELGARSIVEGAVRMAGNRLRVTARLLDSSSSEALWAQEYDRGVGDLFAVQSEISHQIADSLEVEILGGESAALRRPYTANPVAHDDYLKGRSLLNLRTKDSLQGALRCFQQAIRRDPRLALAHAGIGETFSTLAWLEFARPRYAFPRARAAALKAVSIEPTLAEAHTALGFVRFLYDRSWIESESEFRQAIALNPNYSTAHQYYSDYLKAMGRMDEALLEVRRALELDPLSLAINTGMGHVLYLSRRYDDSIAQYRKALEMDPNFAQAHLWFGRPYLEKGEFDEAIREVEIAVRLTGESTMSLAVLAHAYASAGRKNAAKEILARLVRRGKSQYVPSYWIALIQVGLEDRNRAFTWLERADRERSAWLAWIAVEPRFDALRKDARFAGLLRRLKLS
jgi:adenylate cyclase